jgi:hypothetical protein
LRARWVIGYDVRPAGLAKGAAKSATEGVTTWGKTEYTDYLHRSFFKVSVFLCHVDKKSSVIF